MRYMGIKGEKNHAERGEKPRRTGRKTTPKKGKNHAKRGEKPRLNPAHDC